VVPKRAIPVFIVIFFTLSFSSCTCIYFNTFHNIRKNFNGAEKTRKAANRDEAKGTESKQYNDAITKASRVLERHPNSSWVDDALYIIGASYYYLGKYDRATRKFKELFANYPESEYVPESRLIYAKAKLKNDETAEAVTIFEDIFNKDKNKKRKAEAARVLGEHYFEVKDYEQANSYYQALVDSLGDNTDRLYAKMYIADSYFDRFAYDKAIQNYTEALKYDPDTLQTYKIKFRSAEADFFLNNIQDGLDKLYELESNELYFDSLPAIRLKMALGYEWDGDLDAAIDMYERITIEHPRTDASAQAFYELGLIYQYELEDLEKARSYYSNAREEKRKSPVYEDATKRASTLSLLEEYSQYEQDAEKDSTDAVDTEKLEQAAHNQFLLGELFLFDLEKPDSALTAFTVLLDRYPQSRLAPKAMLALAHIYREDMGDTITADSIMRNLLSEYPDRDEAEVVVDRLGLAGTVADSGYAAQKFHIAEGFYNTFVASDSTAYFARLEAEKQIAADLERMKDSLARAKEDQENNKDEELADNGDDSGGGDKNGEEEQSPDEDRRGLVKGTMVGQGEMPDNTGPIGEPGDTAIMIPPSMAGDTMLADTSAVADTALAGQAADLHAEADSTGKKAGEEEAEKVVPVFSIDVWDKAMDAAKERYSPRQIRLLDSASTYYRQVIAEYPLSNYSIQARYVLLQLYDRYLTTGDSALINYYTTFVDSFPESEYTEEIGKEYQIFPVHVPKRQTRQQQEAESKEEEENAADTTQENSDQVSDTANYPANIDPAWITGEDGKILEPAEQYFLEAPIRFEYPLEAIAYGIENDLYFQIRIDFSGEVVEVKFMNPTQSDELNERILRTVEGTRFDSGRIPPELYDHWFWYKKEVRIPDEYRQ